MDDEETIRDQNNRIVALNMSLQLKGDSGQAPATVEDVLKWANQFYKFITENTKTEKE